MNILIVCHKHPVKYKPRGGERSVRIIAEYLARFHKVICYFPNGKEDYFMQNKVAYYEGENETGAAEADVILTWGEGAYLTYKLSRKYKIPYVLMVRWFRLIQPLPPGDLMTRKINRSFVTRHKKYFTSAKAIITNNNYSAGIIERYYKVKSQVSLVPYEGNKMKVGGRYNGTITLISPVKGLGEIGLINSLSMMMRNERFLLVNCPEDLPINNANITKLPYTENMKDVWEGTKILLYCAYKNDVCGTSRVAIEAMAYGIPVLCNDRSGLTELIPNFVGKDSGYLAWAKKIQEISSNYQYYTDKATEIFDNYDTNKQLEVIKNAIEK
jgi:glycosyltransferase involved in cell wall biosynthesis